MTVPGIAAVVSAEDLLVVKGLFQEYWKSFGFTPCFQNFETELATLPGKYAPPRGRLAMARVNDAAAGCVALRPFDEQRCEAKRLYVRPEFRGLGIGEALMRWAILEARGAGYAEMLGDTMPVMEQALGLYHRIGFERTAPYGDAPAQGAIYIRLTL